MNGEEGQTSSNSFSLPPTPVVPAHGNGEPEGDEIERTLKILVIGDIGTGKTSIIRRYVHNLFSPDYQATIGVDFALKILRWSSSTVLRLQFWDIAGQERFSSMTRVYYRGAAGAIVVLDVGRASTMDGAARWKEDLDSKCRIYGGSPIPAVLMANKCDLIKQDSKEVRERIDEFAVKHGFAGWFPTSAKEDMGIKDAVNQLCNHVFILEQCGQYETPVLQTYTPLRLKDVHDVNEDCRKKKFGPCC
uniref:Ras-related protein Rab n=1 Tax=Trichuris muris TaxID=70415 RepID=A0A5S6R1B1_TRIMR